MWTDAQLEFWAKDYFTTGNVPECPKDNVPLDVDDSSTMGKSGLAFYCKFCGEDGEWTKTEVGGSWGKDFIESSAKRALRGERIECPNCGCSVSSEEDRIGIMLTCPYCRINEYYEFSSGRT